ncbi:ankyrin repeat-containing domain protein, partial [Ilyonectria destructans]
MDSAQLEAILGLWMWTLVADEHVKKSDDKSLQTVPPAEKVGWARIVSAGPDDKTWNDKANNIQGEMNLWLGPSAVEFLGGTLTLDNQGSYGLATLWTLAGDNWKPLVLKEMSSNANQPKSFLPRTLQRFCGWNPVHRVLGEMSSTEQVKLRVQLAELASTNISLLDLCAQELFTALMMSLAGLLIIDKTTIVESAGMVRLENTTVSIFANAFVESGLGSYSDALLCIIPTLRKQLPSPDQKNMLSALIKAADDYRQKSEWERAEILLQWACARFSTTHGEEGNSSHFFARVLRATGELYRWSLAQASSNDAREEFGISGVKWMTESHGSAGQGNAEVKEILDCYQKIAQTIAHGSDHIQHRLVQAIRDRKRTEALYNLCFITTGAFGSDDLQPALPLAVRNNWSEVVSALLEMKANPNSRDEGERTAISYCAELGYEFYVKALIDRGASLDLSEKHQRTPLFWTAQNGHEDIAKLLLNTRYVDANRPDVDGQTPLWVVAENGHEAVIQQLLAKGANAESEDKSGRTPLWVATKNRHEAIIQQLLEKGADLESKDTSGQTPL